MIDFRATRARSEGDIFFPKKNYNQEEAEFLLLDEELTSSQIGHSPAKAWLAILTPWLVHVVLLSLSASMLISAIRLKPTTPLNCIQKHSEFSPGLEFLDDEYQSQRFRGSFQTQTPYKGPPSPEVEDAWAAITALNPMSISEDTLRKINASIYSVKLPDSRGGGYMAMPEFVHQIHCVESLWQATYPTYFQAQHNNSLSHPDEYHTHADHCADILIQKLKCDADVGLMTYSWVKGHPRPTPNFNVQHKCRNFDAALEWTGYNQIETFDFLRPVDEEVVDFVDPPWDPLARS